MKTFGSIHLAQLREASWQSIMALSRSIMAKHYGSLPYAKPSEYPIGRAPRCPKANGISQGELALGAVNYRMPPSSKSFGALCNESRKAIQQQASSNSRPPSIAGGADAGAGGVPGLQSVPKGGMSTTSKANAGSGGITTQRSLPKRGIPAFSKASQRVPSGLEASGLWGSRAVDSLCEEHDDEQNYTGDGAADGGGLATKRKLYSEQQQKGKKSRFAHGVAPRQDGITIAIGTKSPTCSARPYVAQDAQIPVNPRLKLSGRGRGVKTYFYAMPKQIVETKRCRQRPWQYQYRCPHGCKLNIVMCNWDDQTVKLEFWYRQGDPRTVKLQGTQPADRGCPACTRHIQFRLVHEHNALDDDAPEEEVQERQDGAYAYMACLWTPSESKEVARENLKKYIHDALILGYCLRKHCRHRCVLLTTQSTLRVEEVSLLKIFWELRPVEHMKVHPSRLMGSDKRFADVFTKLRALEQTEFSKVILMDLDTIVVQSIDELFGYTAPSALFRGNEYAAAGTKRAGETLFNKGTGSPRGGINAGVMLLAPSSEDFQQCSRRIRQPGPATSAPEQDFLSICDMYIGKWAKLPVKYNWQPHQLRYIPSWMEQNQGERRMPIEQISVFHFSGEVCPRDYFHGGFETLWTGDEHVDFPDFTEKLVKEYSKGKCGVEDRERMKSAILKWKDVHDEAWEFTIEEAVGHDKECPLCRDHPNYVEDAFFGCEKTKDSKDKWFNSKHHDRSTGFKMKILRHYPKLFPQSLSFVADVYKKRHKKRCSGDHSGINNMGDFTPTSDVKFKSSSKRKKRNRNNKQWRSLCHRGECSNQRLRHHAKNVRRRFDMISRNIPQPQGMRSQLRGKRCDQNAFLNMDDRAPTVPHARVSVAKQCRAPTMQTTRYPQSQLTFMPTQKNHPRRYAAH